MKRVLLLGASGNIGKQTLQVMKKDEEFCLVGFSVGTKWKKVKPILKKHPSVKAVCVMDSKVAAMLKARKPGIKVYSGSKGLLKLIDSVNPDLVVNALVGFAGLEPTIYALGKNKTVLLANKESLVVGGELVNSLLANGKGKLIPIDSEHVAISKCLGASSDGVRKLILTASGGAFRGLSLEETRSMKAGDALRHPTWKMGPKITIDSATMMNKCFEVIEAHYLFDRPYEDIEILMHDVSYVHSIVEYKDGTLRADVGKPDMRKPIKWALYEGQVPYRTVTAHDVAGFGNYSFWEFDPERYPLVRYSEEVIKRKGVTGAVLNAANEVAVQAFLRDEIPFSGIDYIVNSCMEDVPDITHPTFEIIKEWDSKTRQKATELIGKVE